MSTAPTMARYLEDFAIGQTFGSGRLRISKEQIRRFATEFDPQPFHVDEAAARETFFAGLAASGWHTAAMTMRLLVDSELKPVGGLIGAGIEELRWPRPVRPGDELRLRGEIIDVRASKSLPRHGLVKVRATTVNQNDEPVQVFIANLIVPRHPAHKAICHTGAAKIHTGQTASCSAGGNAAAEEPPATELERGGHNAPATC